MTTEVLQMTFTNEDGKTVMISVADPKEGLTTEEVRDTMQLIIDRGIFVSSGGALVAIKGARLVARDVTELI